MHRQLADDGLVLNQQDRLRPLCRQARYVSDLGRGWNCFLTESGQVDMECRSLAHLCIHPDISPALFDDTVHRRQPQTSAASLFLCREERFKEVLSDLLSHALPSVAYPEQHILTRNGFDVVHRRGIIQVQVGDLDRKAPPRSHSIPGIQCEVHEHLLNLGWVGSHRPRVLGQGGNQLIGLADDAA